MNKKAGLDPRFCLWTGARSHVLVARAADEFPHQRVRWYPLVVHVDEELEHPHQPHGGGEAGRCLLDPLKQRKRVFLHDRELVAEHRVVDVVGALLGVVDPLELARPDARPHADGLLGRGVAELVVAHDPADETQIGEG